MRYLSQGFIERQHYNDFIRFEVLRKEYLKQTFNFMPEVKSLYLKATKEQHYDHVQVCKLDNFSLVSFTFPIFQTGNY
jgi:hypothetical protein